MGGKGCSKGGSRCEGEPRGSARRGQEGDDLQLDELESSSTAEEVPNGVEQTPKHVERARSEWSEGESRPLEISSLVELWRSRSGSGELKKNRGDNMAGLGWD